MKINNNTFIQNERTQKINKDIETKENSPTKQINSLSAVYPQNYYVSFCAGRDFQTAYSDFKDSEMPITVKNFIENEELLTSPEEFKEFTTKGLKYAQRLAFAKLKNCKTITDIQTAYPNEPAFKDLKTIQELENSRFAPIMKELDKKGVKILNCKEDIPTFLAKKIFFEGKMYKDVAQDFVNALTKEAKEAGLTEALPNLKSMGSSEFFGAFGLITPNGVTYGSAVQYSDPENTRFQKKYLIDLTSEQVNKKIEGFLKSPDTKPKYAMMDAWNNCPQIRKDLSQFISENANNPLFMPSTNDENYNFYDNVFYAKMSKLMIEFWNKYPEHKATIGREIKLALERYDFHAALGKEDLEKHLKSIEEKTKAIKKQIQINKINYDDMFPVVKNIMMIISEKANPMTINNKTTAKDFADLLSKCFSLSEYKVLAGDIKTPEYKKLVPNGIKSKMAQLVKRPEYSNLYNAQNLAIISALSSNNELGVIAKSSLLNSQTDTQNILKKALIDCNHRNGIDKTTADKIEKIYTEFKKPLSNSEKEILKDVLINQVELTNSKDKSNISYMLSSQGKYLWHGLNSEDLKDNTQMEFWKEFDKIYGTNYADQAADTIKKNGLYSEAISVIDAMDFSNIHKQGW